MPISSQAATFVAEQEAPDEIAARIQQFLADHPDASLMEDGRTLFELRSTQYTLSTEHGRCSLHLWNEQHNLVRRVLSATPRSGGRLRLMTHRLGHSRPQLLELATVRQHRATGSRDSARARYVRLLPRLLERHFPDETLESVHASMDLERSFGPAYVRAVLCRGRDCWALISLSETESQTTIDGILTPGLLWLEHCRDQAGGKRLFQGLRLLLPAGTATTTQARLAWLNPGIARYQIFELDPATEELRELDPADHGNLATRLIEATDHARAVAADGRFAPAIPDVLALLPPSTHVLGLLSAMTPPAPGSVPAISGGSAHRRTAPALTVGFTAEARLRSSAELAFSVHGLDFARIRLGYAGQSFNRQLEVTVGSGADETPLTPATAPELKQKVHALFARRSAMGSARDALFRACPESWLASNLRGNLAALDPDLLPAPVYSEVPALTGGGHSLDRGMLDLLATTRSRQIAVIEVKAAEDLHLALQGLDYWIRIRHHHLATLDASTGLGELQQRGYFPGVRLLAEPPHLYLVAPALEIHPATEIVLRYFSPRVPWTLVALDQRWRTHIRPVWRRRSGTPGCRV